MKIVFFGDSVTQGCFELIKVPNSCDLIIDPPSCYGTLLVDKLRERYGEDKIEFVNSGISGDSAVGALDRIDRDVLAHKPDVCVVCFGLNDSGYRDDKKFAEHLGKIYAALKENGIKIISMTPNMMNKYIVPSTLEMYLNTARNTADLQNSGVMDKYMDRVRELSAEYGTYLVDAYAEWKRYDSYGIDTTLLLCNQINHPSRAMHKLFADMLFDCIVKEGLVK